MKEVSSWKQQGAENKSGPTPASEVHYFTK
jgi:hypothetical protein